MFATTLSLRVGLGVDTIHGFTHDAGATGDRFWLQEGQFRTLLTIPTGHSQARQIHQHNYDPTATTSTQRLIFDTDAGDRHPLVRRGRQRLGAASVAIGNDPRTLPRSSNTILLVVPDL